MDYSPPGFSVHGIFQARILEWFAISFYRFLFGDTLCLHSVEYVSHLHKRWRSKIRNHHSSVNNQAGRSKWDSSGKASHQQVTIYREDNESYLTGEEEETQPKKKRKQFQGKCRLSTFSSSPLWITFFSWFLKIQQACLLLKVGVFQLSSLKPVKRQDWWKVYFQGQQPWGGRESGLLTKSQPLPPTHTHWQSVSMSFYRWKEGAKCRNSAVSSDSHAVKLVMWWSDQHHLDCFKYSWSSVPGSVCSHFSEISSQNCGSLC